MHKFYFLTFYTKFLEINASCFIAETNIEGFEASLKSRKKLLLELGNYQLEREVIANPDFNSSRVKKRIVLNGRLLF
jgi:hypothetical protein